MNLLFKQGGGNLSSSSGIDIGALLNIYIYIFFIGNRRNN